MSLRSILRRALPVGVLLAIVTLGSAAVVHAAGGATFRDDANLFTAAGRSRIDAAARDANLRVVVITNNQPFSSRSAWDQWVDSQATDKGAITIGLHAVSGQKAIHVVPGADTNLSPGEANQAVQDARATFNNGSDPSAVSDGVIRLIDEFKSMGATSPSATSSGPGFGWLIPVIIVVILAFLLIRVLGGRRRYAPGTGPYGGFGGAYGPGYGGPGYGPGYGGGGFGRGFLGGVLGGLGGAWLGNQLFGNRDGGDVNAAGPDQNAGPGDTANAQDLQGNWSGDAGGGGWDNSGADAGGWGSDAGGNWGGDSGASGDSGGWSGDSGGGDWGGDSGGGTWT